jgi:hypothetical protein
MKYTTTSMLSENISKTEEGFLLCKNVVLARPGEQVYAASELPQFEAVNGRIIAVRDEAAILAPETIASFEGKTLANLHPKELDILSTNWKQHASGIVYNIRAGDGQNSGLMVGDVLIQDAVTIDAVLNKNLREISLGYEAAYVQEAPGRVRQTHIKGNHVALVPRGRCGALCAIQDHAAPITQEKTTMSFKEKLLAFIGKMNDADFEDDPAKTNDAKVDALTTQVGEITKSLTAITGVVSKVADALEDIKKSKEDTNDEETPEEKAAREKKEKEDKEGSEKVGDAATLSLAEILAPGIQNSATLKVDALKAAYKTADGKAAIDIFTSGKEVDYNSPSAVEVAFIGSANLLKEARVNDAAATKAVTIDQLSIHKPKADTPEVVNKRNAEFWKKQA